MVSINVPYQPIPQAQPTPTTPFVGDVATPQAFGVNIGRAQEQLGQTMERASSALESNVLQMQGYKTEAEVNAGVTDYILKGGDLTNRFRQLPGSQAQDQLKQHTQDLDDLRQGIRGSMSSPKAQRDFDNATMHRFALDVVGSSQYAAQQSRQFTKETYAAKGDALEQEGIRNLQQGVPGALKATQKALRQNEIDAGKFDGLNPDMINKKDRDTQTRYIANVATSVAKTDPKRAYQILDEAAQAKAIDASKVDVIRSQIDDRAVQYYATMDGAEIATRQIQSDPISFSKDPEGTLIRMDADADRLGKERSPNDPVLAQRITDELKRHNVNSTNLAKKEQDQRNLGIRNELLRITDTALPNGRKPLNEQEANSIDPNFSNWLAEAKRRDPMNALRIEHAFAANAAKGNTSLTPDQIAEANKQWAGLTNAQKQNVNPNKLFLDGKIDGATRDKMNSELNKMTSLSTNTNDADVVLKHYKGVLNDQNIRESVEDKDANARYVHLRGALQLRIEDEQRRLGRPVKMWTPEEEKRIVNQLMGEVDSGEKHIWGSSITEPSYEHIYKTQVAPPMPDFVKKVAPNAEWNMGTQRWQTTVNGQLVSIRDPKAAK